MLRSLHGVALAASIAVTATASAQLSTYTQDFESMDSANTGVLGADGWLVFARVTDTANNFLYDYGPFPAPNQTGGFSNVGITFSGPAQGIQNLDVFSDYLNGDHGANRLIESLIFQEQSIDAADVGQTYTFQFDHLQNPLVINGIGQTTTKAFIRVLQSSNGSFALLSEISFDTTMSSPTTWATDSIDVTIDPAWDGELVQFGFLSVATNFEDSSRLYDNISFSSPTSQPPSLSDYAQDFEALDITDGNALGNDGWIAFANVFDSGGGFQYGYGPFGAPNGGPGFSAIATGSGGAPQGQQYLNAYSDYANADHGNGLVINALVFQEQGVNAADVGKTVRLSFDYLKNPMVTNGDGQTTTRAFLKVLKRTDFSFAELGASTLDTTNASTTTWASGSIELTIDPTWVGELLQFGFESRATNFEDSGRFYDNVEFVNIATLGTNYCQSSANSSGQAAVISGIGSPVASANDVMLLAEGMPNNQFGIFIVSAAQGNGPLSNGFLCLGGAIGRYRAPGQILSTGGTGSFQLPIDLTAIPQGGGTVPTMAGQTWNFQAWFRDGVGAGSDLTDGLEILFQ